MKKLLLVSVAAFILPVVDANAAEIEVSVYGGIQTLPHSRVKGQHPAIGNFDALIGWDGKSFGPPPYYGLRAMWWQPNGWGFGIELTHAKAYAPHNEMTAAGFDDLEFTDGHNLITLNAAKRWENKWKSYTPYAGVGLGIAMPHVDVTPTGGESTYGYQMTGPVLRLTAGVTRALTDRISLFGEYQFSVSQNEAELDGGGDLSTRLITNALNVGISYSF